MNNTRALLLHKLQYELTQLELRFAALEGIAVAADGRRRHVRHAGRVG